MGASEPHAGGVAGLVAEASLEIGAHRLQDVPALAAQLPRGSRVYITHMPRKALAQSFEVTRALHAAGLEPVPHLAARRITSSAELREFLERAVNEAGVRGVLVIGGDVPQPAGPYADGAALLASGLLAACGVREAGIAGYPDGHPAIPAPALRRAMEEKLYLGVAQRLDVHVVTQFSFSPERITAFCAELAQSHPGLRVRVGLAGPADTATLLRYAKACGVSASLRGLRALGWRLLHLATRTEPREQLAALARYRLGAAAPNLAGVHFFSFGGAASTAAWMSGMAGRRGGAAAESR